MDLMAILRPFLRLEQPSPCGLRPCPITNIMHSSYRRKGLSAKGIGIVSEIQVKGE